MGTGGGIPIVIGIDTGGTFTDVFTSDARVLKVPSSPQDPVAAILRAVHAIGAGPQDAVAHGTTVATNAVLERKGARTTLLTTAGFEDVLEIRRQNRPAIYDLHARWPEPLVPAERRLGVSERLDYRGEVLRPFDEAEVPDVVREVRASGSEVLAICLLFSFVNPTHERALRTALRAALGTDFSISLSSDVAPQYGEYERTSTTVVNAYVMPVMQRYLQALSGELENLHVMQSNGGLVPAAVAAERPVQTVLSGPAAGVVGARVVAARAGYDEIITFDMGGTSTDVAVVPGEVLEGTEGEIASFPLLVPMLRIETVGAGGGSIARLDAAGGLRVGPESAGADPGPAAYGRGDVPTVSDANLVLGRLSAQGLLGGSVPLDVERSRRALEPLAEQLALTVEQVAWAVVRLANSNMERAVRVVTLQRGYDPRRFTLFPFGGAGPLHAVELAEGLGIKRLLIPPHPGVMAALGLTVPDLQRDYMRTVRQPFEWAREAIESGFADLETQARLEVQHETLFGAPVLQRFLDLRYRGQSFELRVPYAPSPTEVLTTFTQHYLARYGYVPAEQVVEVVYIRLRAVSPRFQAPRLVPDWPQAARILPARTVWFGATSTTSQVRAHEVPVLWRSSLPIGTVVSGPAVIEQYDSATLLPPEWTARVDGQFNLVVEPYL